MLKHLVSRSTRTKTASRYAPEVADFRSLRGAIASNLAVRDVYGKQVTFDRKVPRALKRARKLSARIFRPSSTVDSGVHPSPVRRGSPSPASACLRVLLIHGSIDLSSSYVFTQLFINAPAVRRRRVLFSAHREIPRNDTGRTINYGDPKGIAQRGQIIHVNLCRLFART